MMPESIMCPIAKLSWDSPAPGLLCGEDDNIEIVNEEDVLSDYMRFRVNDLYGVMRRATGKVILSAEYEAVYMASPTLLGAQLEGTDSYVLYDMQGRRVDCEIK